MNHYVQCPFWYYLLLKLWPSPWNVETLTSPQPLTRLGLVNPSPESLLSVSASFAGYHAMKRGIGSEHSSPDPLSSEQIRKSHLQFLDAYIAAAHDCGLSPVAFSTAVREL